MFMKLIYLCKPCVIHIIKMKIHSIQLWGKDFVETHLCTLCVILRSRVLRVVCPHKGYRSRRLHINAWHELNTSSETWLTSNTSVHPFAQLDLRQVYAIVVKHDKFAHTIIMLTDIAPHFLEEPNWVQNHTLDQKRANRNVGCLTDSAPRCKLSPQPASDSFSPREKPPQEHVIHDVWWWSTTKSNNA